MSNYGVLPPKTDLRDYRIKAGATNIAEFKLDNLPSVKNQRSVNSCAAFSSSSILEWFNQRETGKYCKLSTGFIYGMQGVAFNRFDSGMYLRDVCKILQKYGDCLFDTIPFNVEMPGCYNLLRDKLNKSVYDEAEICRVKSYSRCDTADAVKYALLNHSPVLASVKWYDKAVLGEGNLLEFDTKTDYGYHAVMVYGFNEKGWLCQNSWGSSWGDDGRFVLPYNYGLEEAWSFVDLDNSGIHKPMQNKLLNLIYRIFNFVINLLKGR